MKKNFVVVCVVFFFFSCQPSFCKSVLKAFQNWGGSWVFGMHKRLLNFENVFHLGFFRKGLSRLFVLENNGRSTSGALEAQFRRVHACKNN